MKLRRVAPTLLAPLLVLVACTDEPSVEGFCAAAEDTVAAGPLFPDRTDGEPVAEPDALAALEDLAAASPNDIDDAVEVLLAEARALVADAEARQDAATSTTGTSETTVAPDTGRPTRAEVDAAQAAVVAYAAEECNLDLTA